ncbi:MAG: NAD(P)H-dependent oxidoreductase subunit E [Deltaproteobacteria bacterium]|nr:NAD(P)H-dependent oxidoreductase subunit E [Deltaproteobacteria bacterium]
MPATVPTPASVSRPAKTLIDPEHVLRIVDKNAGSRGALIAILEDLQATYNYLPRDALRIVAKKTGSSLVDIYGVATFYSVFSLQPRGEHLCSVCMGTACHVRGSPRILEEFEHRLGVPAGQTTPDRTFTLATVNCVGACALGPVVVLDGEYHRNTTTRDVKPIIHDCLEAGRAQKISSDQRIFRVAVACPACNRSLMDHDHPIEGQPTIHVTITFGSKHGWLRLSSLYGDFRISSELEIPPETVVTIFCPRCHAELKAVRTCARCDAPMIALLVRAGGILQICSRRGCKEHMLDLGD